MKKRALLIAMTTLVMCLSMLAHEFWIQPSRTKVRVGERVSLYTMLGEKFTGEKWKGNGTRVSSYKHFYKDDVRDLLLSIEPGEAIVDLPDFIPHEEGTHMLTLSTTNAFIEMEAKKFEDYLKDDGLMDAYEYRNSNNEKFEPGRERFKRCAKVLIQAGAEADHTYKKKADLELEIIPLANPYDHDIEKGITFKVLYEGEPLEDAMVKWWHKDGEDLDTDFLYTDNRGEVTFSAATPGMYMISTVHMIRLLNDPGADWQSTWSTLVFGRDF